MAKRASKNAKKTDVQVVATQGHIIVGAEINESTKVHCYFMLDSCGQYFLKSIEDNLDADEVIALGNKLKELQKTYDKIDV